MRILEHGIHGYLLVLAGCSELAGIEAIPCQPGCKDGATRVFCDETGKARTEACPPSSEECAVAACEAGACTFKPAVGAACGEILGAHCNEGFACLGDRLFLTANRQHTCLAADDGKVWCWGDNTYGELGDGTTKPGLHPVLVRGLPGRATRVTAGYAHTCALLQSGEVYCWGNNQGAQCSMPPSDPISTPVLVNAPGVNFTQIIAGQGHTCAVAADKSVYCWGNTTHGQCGIDPALTGEHFVGPAKIPGLDNVDHVNSVKNHICALRTQAPTMMCWGSNTHVEEDQIDYKLGPAAGELPYSATPVPVELDADVLDVGMGYESTYALTVDRRIYAWGRNGRLQLGTGQLDTIVRTPSLVLVETPSGLAPFTGGAAMIRSDGSDQCVRMDNPAFFEAWFMCWGADDFGELGVGTQEGARTSHQFPVPVRALPPTFNWLVRGENHACGAGPVEGRTEIWCYGRPGALGNGTERVEDTAPPTQWEGTPVVWDPAEFAPALQ